MEESARGVLAATLDEAREALPAEAAHTRRLIGELLERLADASERELADALVAVAGADEERRAELADAIGLAARRLAPEDEPPSGTAADAWEALVAALDRLYGGGVVALGRLPFVGDRLLELLADEAHTQLAEVEQTGRRATGAPGRVLASLAVSRKLRDAVAAGLGLDVVPSYHAVYLYDPPGSHVRTHVDARYYEVVFHLILDHTPPSDGSAGSALVAHVPGARRPDRVSLRRGEAVALRGRGTIHSWTALREDEHRTLIAIGFERGAGHG